MIFWSKDYKILTAPVWNWIGFKGLFCHQSEPRFVIFLLLCFKFILFKGQNDREGQTRRERNLPSVGWFPERLQSPGLDQAQVRKLELHAGFSHWLEETQVLSDHSPMLSQVHYQGAALKWCSWDSNSHSVLECHCSKQFLNLLCHRIGHSSLTF